MNASIDNGFSALGQRMGVAFHPRCSAQEIDRDDPVIVCGSGPLTHLGAKYYLCDVDIALVTPGLAGDDPENPPAPETHQAASSRLAGILGAPDEVAGLFHGGADVELAGSFLRGVETTIEEGRWITTFNLRVGIRAV